MKFLIIFSFAVLALSQSFSQDSITIADAEQMRYRAENLVKDDLRKLLNNLATSELETSEIKTLINNSHSGNSNRIFYNSRIIIEDDIDPTFKNSTNTRDSELEKYLADFDILYTKSSNNSVIFSNVRSSNPKKASDNYIYVKVFYNSFFRNPNKTIERPYTVNNRVASVRIEKQNNRWTPFINAITFFNAEDTLNDYANDIPLINENLFAIATAGKGMDSASAADNLKQLEALYKAEARQKEINEQKAFNDKFYNLIEKGDKSLASNDFTAALQNYNEAKEMMPYDPMPRSKILNAIRKKESNSINEETLYKDYLSDAVRAEKNRDFEKAMMLYKKAISNKPEMATEHEAKIKILENKWRIVYALDQKYNSGFKLKDLIDEYDVAIKKNKGNSDLYLGRGKCYEKQNNFKKALSDYSQAYSIDVTNLAALKHRAFLYRNNNKFIDALTDYKAYLINDQEDSSIYESVADVILQIKSDNYNGAIDELDKGLQVNERWSTLHYKKGTLQAQKNDIKGAIYSFGLALLNDSSNALSYFQRGKNYLAQNNITNAAYDFNSARDKGLDSLYIHSIESYGRVYYDRALQKIKESSKDSALVLLDYAISIDPTNSEYRFKRGEFFMEAKIFHESIKSFSEAIELNENYTEAFYKRGLANVELKNFRASVDDFKSSVALDNKHFNAQKELGDAYFALKEYQPAALNYEKFLQTVNSIKNASSANVIAKVHNSLGKSYFKMNESDERALSSFRNAIKKEDNYAEAYYNRGLYLFKKKQLADAIEDMKKAVSLNSKLAEWDFNLASAYKEKRDFNNAAYYYTSAINKDTPQLYKSAYYLLANSNYELQKYSTAIKDYEKVQSLGLDNSIPSFNYELAIIYLNINKPDSALNYLLKDYQTDSTYGPTLYAISISKLLMGNKDEALNWLDKALQTKQINKNTVKKERLMANLHDDKRFKALINKYK